MSISAWGERFVPSRARPFLFLSHPHSIREGPPALWSRYYLPGNDDALFVLGWGILLIIARWIFMAMFKSFARRWLDTFHPLPPKPPKEQRDSKVGVEYAIQQANNVATSVTTNGSANGNNAKLRKPPNGATNNTHPLTNGTGEKEKEEEDTTRSRSRAERKSFEKALKLRERTATRFAEQGFTCLYYIFAWSCGLYIYSTVYRSPLDTDFFWEEYPHLPIPAPVKFYYLLALAFYSTQVVILNIEAPRNDHVQMLTHHIVTVLLIAASYATNLTKIGCAVLFILDWCDISLPLAKMSKYLEIPLVPDIIFVVFLISWFVTRQIFFVKIVWAVTFDMPVRLSLQWEPENSRYVTKRGWIFFFVCLWILVILLCMWFFLACKVAYSVIMGKAAEEPRSDAEAELEDNSSSSSRSSSRASSKKR